MTYDPSRSQKANLLSCQRQYELAKIQADQETSKLRYMIEHPACLRFTQLADRIDEHNLILGRKGAYINNTSRVTPQVSVLDFPNYNCDMKNEKK